VKNSRLTYAEIDLSAVVHNYRLLCAQAGADVTVLAVVKANAYGHGAVAVSRALAGAGAPMFAVASVEEAAELRHAGIEQPILVMGIVLPGQEELLLQYRLTPYIFDFSTARRLSALAVQRGCTIGYHLKIDTGMSRIGFDPVDLPQVLSLLKSFAGLEMQGVMSHFALADAPDDPFTAEQVKRFRRMIESIRAAGFAPEYIHQANSAGILTGVASDWNLARPGIALYGGLPSAAFATLDLRPVMSLRSGIVQIRTVSPGTGVSYGHQFVAERRSRIATVQIGYADGYNRLLSGVGDVLVGGERVPVVGRVCMDWILLDVTDVDNVQVGDEVTLLGSDSVGNTIRAEEWAEKIGTINYEVFCGISGRVPRKYV
jgi:alanine racemase